MRMPGVVESAVIGVPHPDFGEGVTAVVVRAGHGARPGGGDPRRLEGPPRQIQAAQAGVFVDDLPRNAMGKVQKNLLREMYGDYG